MSRAFAVCRVGENSLVEVVYNADKKELKIYKVDCAIDSTSDYCDCWSESCGHYTESGPEYDFVDIKEKCYDLIKTKADFELEGVQDWDNFDDEKFESWANEHNFMGCDDWLSGSLDDGAYDDLLWDYYESQGFQSNGGGKLISYNNGCYYDSSRGSWYDEKTGRLVF